MKRRLAFLQTYGWANVVGYAVSFLCLLSMAAFQCTGYLQRPYVFDPDQFTKILNSNLITLQPLKCYRYGQIAGNDVMVFITEGQYEVGLLIPIESCTIPEHTRRLGVVMNLFYLGKPVISYGFTNWDPATGRLSTNRFFRKKFQESNDMMISSWGLPRIRDEEVFPLSWKEAKYLYFGVYADERAEVAVGDIQFIGN